MSDLILELTTLDRVNLVKQTKKFSCKCKKEVRLAHVFVNHTAECFSQS